MTQPGVSKHLSALESHIGKKLFERTTRKLIPTEYGKFLYTQIQNPLQELEKVEYYSGQRTKKERLAISIGCTPDFFRKELIHTIYSFDMYIVTHFGSEKELIEALEMDKIQLLVGIKKHNFYHHQFKYLKNQQLALISSKDVSLPTDIDRDKNNLKKWLQKQTWFAYSNELSDAKAFWRTNFNTDFKLVPRYVLPSYLHIIEALKSNSGFSIVPIDLCEEELNSRQVKAPLNIFKPTHQELFFSFKPNNSNLKEVNSFMEKMEASISPQ